MKTCSKCGETKPVAEFSRNARREDGLQAHCKACNARYRAENPEAIAARQRRYYTGNREACLANKRQYYIDNREAILEQVRSDRLARNYGITPGDYDDKLEAQGNACAICGKTPEENGQRLAVDHCHETGKVRGLLCTNCNWHLEGLAAGAGPLAMSATVYLSQEG